MDELKRIEEKERKADRRKTLCKGYRNTHDFKFKTMHVFHSAINHGIITKYMANNEQSKLAKSIREFKNKTRPSNPQKHK